MKNFAPRAALLALALTLLATAPAAAQGPVSALEGVWLFQGGRIAIERQEDGSYLGTIIRRTTIDDCPQEIGERVWIDMRLQDDGSYWGQHQFFRTGGECEVVPDRGNTAYRVINRAGVTFLRVCFARPDTPGVQPKIAEDGTATDANGGCRDAEFFDLMPRGAPKLEDIVTLPAQRRGCALRRRFTARFKQPRTDALTSVKVTLNGQRLRVRRVGDRLRTTVDLRRLPRGRYRLRVVAETARGQTITGTRRYRNCP